MEDFSKFRYPPLSTTLSLLRGPPNLKRQVAFRSDFTIKDYPLPKATPSVEPIEKGTADLTTSTSILTSVQRLDTLCEEPDNKENAVATNVCTEVKTVAPEEAPTTGTPNTDCEVKQAIHDNAIAGNSICTTEIKEVRLED